MLLMFGDLDYASWGTLPYAVRTLFDAMLGNYLQLTYPRRDLEYKIIFTLFMLVSHIFLLNFLIAILSLTYVEMSERGKFEFLRNRYQYIEKFMTPLKDECGYQELIIQPSPVNMLSFPILILLPNKDLFKKASFYYSFVVFWLENVIFVIFFFFKMLFSVPRIYILTASRLLQAPKKAVGVKYIFIWIFIGIFCLCYFAMTDTINLIHVLLYRKSTDKKIDNEDVINEQEDLQKTKMQQVMILNELVQTMKSIKKLVKVRQEQKKSKGGKLKKTPLQDIRDLEGLIKNESIHSDDEPNIEEDYEEDDEDVHFIIRKDLLVNAWKKFRPKEERKEAPSYKPK